MHCRMHISGPVALEPLLVVQDLVEHIEELISYRPNLRHRPNALQSRDLFSDASSAKDLPRDYS